MAGIALATANFVDTAIRILYGNTSRHDIYIPLAVLLLVLAFVNILGSVTKLIYACISLSLMEKIEPLLIQKQAALNYLHIENNDSWEIISRVMRDPVDNITKGLQGFTSFAQLVTGIASFFLLIIIQLWWAAFIIFIFAVPLFYISIWAGKKKYEAGVEAEKFNRRTEYLNDVLISRENIDERTIFGYSTAIIKEWQKQYSAGRKLNLTAILKSDLLVKASSLSLVAIGFLVAAALISPVINGDLSAGMYIGIVVAVFAIVQDMGWQLSTALQDISHSKEYMKDFTAFLDLSKAEGALDAKSKFLFSINETKQEFNIEFKHVSFKYPTGDEYILKDISFVLSNNTHYALVGKNGAGKTTIIKLLTGLYTDYEGEIFINGQELRTYSSNKLKSLFSVVYQDFAKYYISLKDNIALGNMNYSKEEYSDTEIYEIAKLAGLDPVINSLNKGLHTVLGRIKKDGQDISGGEWQRLAIARTLISSAPIKILDEPTAALDPISESTLYDEFNKLIEAKHDSYKNRITIFISHRLGSIKLADEILVIDEGRIAAQGSHRVLIEAKGLYYEMYEKQKEWYV